LIEAASRGSEFWRSKKKKRRKKSSKTENPQSGEAKAEGTLKIQKKKEKGDNASGKSSRRRAQANGR